MPRNRGGFTIIELLVVVLILGILAAIAFPRFSGSTRDKARFAALRSDVRNTELAEESYYADFGNYGTLAELQASGLINASPGNTLTITVATGGYRVLATNSTIASATRSCGVRVGAGVGPSLDGVISCP